MPPVPAGLHTLTSLELCPTAAASRTGAGTIARGAARRRHDADEGAERSIAADTFGRVVACRIDDGCRQPEARHDAVIDAAVDLDRAGALTTKRSSSWTRVFAVERRDFYRRGPASGSWGIDAMDAPIKHGPVVWRQLPPAGVGQRLLVAFRTHSPALSSERRAS